MWNIRPEQLIDAILIEVKSNGECDLRRISAAKRHDDGGLYLTLIRRSGEHGEREESAAVWISPAQWSMCHYHHIYEFTRNEDPKIHPRIPIVTTVIISPRP